MVAGVELKGFNEYVNLLNRAQKNIKLVNIATLKEVLQLMYETAYREAPKGETGFLRDSIGYFIINDSDGKEVGTFQVTAPYARYVAYGTSTQRARPFWQRANIVGKLALLRIAGINLKKALRGDEITPTGPDSVGGNVKTPRKYLYKSKFKGGRTRYHYSSNRAGTVKFRGLKYRGRNFAARGEVA